MNWGFHDNRFPELCSGKSFIFAKAYFSDCIVSSVLIEACRRTLFENDMMVRALVDRLTYRSHVLDMNIPDAGRFSLDLERKGEAGK